MQAFDSFKYLDRSALNVSPNDITWCEQLLFNQYTDRWCKDNLTHYFSVGKYYPPNAKKHQEKVAIINFLKLKNSQPLSILDIGAGAGHFLTLCKNLGHNVTGTEIPEMLSGPAIKLYNYYNLNFESLEIKSNTPLHLSKKYDLIVAARTVFDTNWTYENYNYLKNQIFDHLNPNGRFFIKTNIKHLRTGKVQPEALEVIKAFGQPLIGWNSFTFLFQKT